MFEKIPKRYNFNDNVSMMVKKYIVSLTSHKYFIFFKKETPCEIKKFETESFVLEEV